MTSRRIGDIEYQLRPGTRRRTTDIVIERDGRVVVRPPAGYTPEQVDGVVASKRLWIYRNLAEWKDLNAAAVVREWVNGETFLYLGGAYRLALVSGQDRPLKLKDRRFCLSREVIERGGTEAARKAFEQFYTDKGQQRFEARAVFFAPKVGVTVAGIKVKDMGFRWAISTTATIRMPSGMRSTRCCRTGGSGKSGCGGGGPDWIYDALRA